MTGAFRVLALDARGHGHSSRAPDDVSPAAHVADVCHVLERLAGGPVVLAGQSLGGHTALLVAAARPDLVRALVVIEAGPDGGEDAGALAAEVGESLRGWPVPFGSRASAHEFFAGRSRSPAAWVEGLEQRADGWWPRFEVDVMVRTLREALRRPVREQWAQIRAPTLIVRGSEARCRSRRSTGCGEICLPPVRSRSPARATTCTSTRPTRSRPPSTRSSVRR